MIDNIIGGTIIAVVVGLLGLLGYGLYKLATSPTFTLTKSEWECSRYETRPVTTFITSGKILIPITTYQTYCTQYTRR